MSVPAKPLVLLLLAALAWGGALLARERAQDIAGPLAVAVHGDQVAVMAPGVLYRLDGNGQLLGSARDLIDPRARDGGLYWLDDRLLASPGRDGGKLLRCELAEAMRCEPFSSDPYTPTGAVQAAPAPDDRLWLLETDADRAHRFFPDGRRIDVPLSAFRHPGALWQQDDQLYICNTGAGVFEKRQMHKRGIDEPQETRFDPDREYQPANLPLRLLPRADGGFRLILTNAVRTRGRLVDVDAGGVHPLAVPGLVNPVSMAAAGDTTLIVDADRMQVLQLAADGTVHVFGDAAFRSALDTGVALRDRLRLADPLLLTLANLLAAIGGSWLLALYVQRRSDAPLPVATGADGIAWLPAANARLPEDIGRGLLAALPLAVLPLFLAASLRLGNAGVAWALLVLAGTALLVWRRSGSRSATRIGLRGKVLLVADPERGLNEYRLAQLRWNERELRPDEKMSVPLMRDSRDLFHKPTLESALFPLLDPQRKIADAG